ncbi:WecB/TagA/CpsF family glycosyltransferase [Marinobacterium sp. YM272]|uniref:WecB/TagA/CpsF family glycosyltransferase n=1 Tax=Marinobacterium sp. YM272 TaxID=3421654 RepID=UPI003D7FBB1F
MSNENSVAFGVDFFTADKSSLLSDIEKRIYAPYSFVVTPNVDHLVQLNKNHEFRDAYCKASIRICDSRVLSPLLRSLGVIIQEVIPGSDLTLDLLSWANRDRLRLVLIGGSELEVERLRLLYPGIFLYHHNPPMGFIERVSEVDECLNFIRDHHSEIVLYAVGAPRQEILASYIEPNERTGVGFCIGASISFATGTIKRAPKWMQKAKLEWLHRMVSDPRRLVKRYFNDFLFIVVAYCSEKLKSRKL